jgi:hypothetical protein
MGAKYWPSSWNPFKRFSNAYTFDGLTVGFAPHHLKFHKDWNWLMWAVDKIEEHAVGNRIEIDNNFCKISSPYNIEPIFVSKHAHRKFWAVYLAVVDYIKSYHEILRTKEVEVANNFFKTIISAQINNTK